MSNIIKFQLQKHFQRFLYQTLCVFSQMKAMNISDGIIILSHGSCPRGGLLFLKDLFFQISCRSQQPSLFLCGVGKTSPRALI